MPFATRPYHGRKRPPPTFTPDRLPKRQRLRGSFVPRLHPAPAGARRGAARVSASRYQLPRAHAAGQKHCRTWAEPEETQVWKLRGLGMQERPRPAFVLVEDEMDRVQDARSENNVSVDENIGNTHANHARALARCSALFARRRGAGLSLPSLRLEASDYCLSSRNSSSSSDSSSSVSPASSASSRSASSSPVTPPADHEGVKDSDSGLGSSIPSSESSDGSGQGLFKPRGDASCKRTAVSIKWRLRRYAKNKDKQPASATERDDMKPVRRRKKPSSVQSDEGRKATRDRAETAEEDSDDEYECRGRTRKTAAKACPCRSSGGRDGLRKEEKRATSEDEEESPRRSKRTSKARDDNSSDEDYQPTRGSSSSPERSRQSRRRDASAKRPRKAEVFSSESSDSESSEGSSGEEAPSKGGRRRGPRARSAKDEDEDKPKVDTFEEVKMTKEDGKATDSFLGVGINDVEMLTPVPASDDLELENHDGKSQVSEEDTLGMEVDDVVQAATEDSAEPEKRPLRKLAKEPADQNDAKDAGEPGDQERDEDVVEAKRVKPRSVPARKPTLEPVEEEEEDAEDCTPSKPPTSRSPSPLSPRSRSPQRTPGNSTCRSRTSEPPNTDPKSTSDELSTRASMLSLGRPFFNAWQKGMHALASLSRAGDGRREQGQEASCHKSTSIPASPPSQYTLAVSKQPRRHNLFNPLNISRHAYRDTPYSYPEDDDVDSESSSAAAVPRTLPPPPPLCGTEASKLVEGCLERLERFSIAC